MKTYLSWSLLSIGIIFIMYYLFNITKGRKSNNYDNEDIFLASVYGIVGGVLNTLGIGSQETSRTFLHEEYEDRSLVKNTALVGFTIPVMVAAFIFVNNIRLDYKTIIMLALSGILGTLCGTFFGLSRFELILRQIVSLILLTLGAIMLFQKFYYLPYAKTNIALNNVTMAAGLVCNFCFGVILSQGLSLMAPSLAVLLTIGITPRTALTTILFGLSFMLATISAKIIKKGHYLKKTTFVMTIAGSIGSYIGFSIFKDLSIEAIRWAFIIAVVYTGITNLMEVIKTEDKLEKETKKEGISLNKAL